MFNECLAIDKMTHEVEVRELTDVMAENLSETAYVLVLNFTGDTTTVWSERVPSVMHVDRSTLYELKRRAIARDERNGWVS